LKWPSSFHIKFNHLRLIGTLIPCGFALGKKDVILARTIENYYFKVGVLMSLDKATNIFIPSTYWSLILTPMKFIFSIVLKVFVHQMIIKMH